MRVLVTGGCGYIGSVLVPQLQEERGVNEVVVFDSLVDGSPRNLLDSQVNDDFVFRRGDVRDLSSVAEAMCGSDAVVHLAAITGAAETHDKREKTFAVNLEGTRNVLNAAEKAGVGNVVFASSCNVYGRASNTALDETVDPLPINPYAESKLKAERLLAEYVTKNAFDGTALRMSTNYGFAPGVRFNLVVNHFVFRAVTDRSLTVYGDGSNWRPFVHVRDAARAFKHVLLQPEAWSEVVYNVGANAENYRIEEIAAIVCDEIDCDLEITYLSDKQPGPSYNVGFDRLTETGFSIDTSLREGVRELADRFRGRRQESQIYPTIQGGQTHD